MVGVITFPPFSPGGPGPLQGLRGLRFKGTWDPLATYVVNDAVYFNGSSYIAIAINSSQQPDVSSASWSIIALGSASSLSGVVDTLSSITAIIGSLIYKATGDPAGWAALAPGTAGQVLQTAGPNQNPSWVSLAATQNLSAVQQSFTTTSTYTPTIGLKASIFECWGAGGGGGGAENSAVGQSSGGFGGSGGYSRKLVTALVIGTGQTIVIGAGGLGGTAGNNNGTAGGDTTIGTTLVVAKGGSPGLGAAANTSGLGGAGGITGTGDEANIGSTGEAGASSVTADVFIPSGRGGSTSLGNGGLQGLPPDNLNSGAGGGAGISAGNSGDQPGGAGANGFCRITEFVFS